MKIGADFCVCAGLKLYLPLPIEGKATDLSFFSSARARQFFTVLSSISSHLSEPQPGLLQWMTNFAGRPNPEVTAAEERSSDHQIIHCNLYTVTSFECSE